MFMVVVVIVVLVVLVVVVRAQAVVRTCSTSAPATAADVEPGAGDAAEDSFRAIQTTNYDFTGMGALAAVVADTAAGDVATSRAFALAPKAAFRAAKIAAMLPEVADRHKAIRRLRQVPQGAAIAAFLEGFCR